jgi:cytochrome c oxidase subunit 2
MKLSRFLLSFLAMGLTGSAFAEETHGIALPWQLGLQTPVTPVMEKLYNLHSGLLILITVITIFVLGLLGYVCIRFSAKNNPTPSKTTHNTLVEIVWTTIPILILVAIAIPSLRIHYFMDRAQNAEMTLKVVGYQWYWGYEYPDQGDISFESHITPDPTKLMSPEEEHKILGSEPRLLTVDQPAIVPVDTVVRVLVTGSDVIHSWSVPAFGVKIDAVPGRVNETWFKATQIGTYRGQCSQLCGIWHGFMPIVVKVVSKEDFAAWVASQKKAASNDNTAPAAAAPATETKAPPATAAPATETKATPAKTAPAKPATPKPAPVAPTSPTPAPAVAQ